MVINHVKTRPEHVVSFQTDRKSYKIHIIISFKHANVSPSGCKKNKRFQGLLVLYYVVIDSVAPLSVMCTEGGCRRRM